MALTFLHPHLETTVVDNSLVTEPEVVGGTTLFMPFFSNKGIDNQLQLFTSQAKFISETGVPNFKEYGQPGYNILNCLRGGGQVYGIRLLPEEATYANAVISVNISNGTSVPDIDDSTETEQPETKGIYSIYAIDEDEFNLQNDEIEDNEGEIEDDGVIDTPETDIPEVNPDEDTDVDTDNTEGEEKPEEPVKRTLRRAVVSSIKNANSKNALKLTTVSESASEFPILVMRAKGRGKYGNKISFSLELESGLGDTYDFPVYSLRVYEISDKGQQLLVEGPYQVSLFPEAVSTAGSSMFIKNIVERYSKYIEVEVNEANIDLVYDILYKESDEEYFLPQSADILCLGSTDGVIASTCYSELLNGTDTGNELNDRLTDTQKEELLIKAYRGQIDLGVLHKRQYPFDFVLDANFSTDVKKEMISLCSDRGDVFGFLDCGLGINTSADALNSPAANLLSKTYYTGLYGQPLTVYDTFTNSDIQLTFTFALAYKVPYNDATYGVQYPLAGPNRGVVEGFKSIAFNPIAVEKEELYKAKINYVEQDYKNAKLMSQLTMQDKNTALSNINNVRVLMRMIRRVEEISESYYFEHATDGTLNAFSAAINNAIGEWVTNSACTTATATVYQNDYDAAQKIVRVRIAVVFTDIIERIVIEFNVGR